MSNLYFDLLGQSCEEFCLKHGKTGNKKRATCFALLPQNELNGDVARFTTHVQTCYLLQDRFYMGGKTRNIAIQMVLQQCCKTSCTFLVTRFSAPLLAPLPSKGYFQICCCPVFSIVVSFSFCLDLAGYAH